MLPREITPAGFFTGSIISMKTGHPERIVGRAYQNAHSSLERIRFIIVLVSSMRRTGSGSIHVFVKSFNFAIIHCEHMGKVTAELSACRFNTPGVMTKGHDFVS
jgi:hypothetical protein